MTKPNRKVKLPCDRTGSPIGIGDVLEWDDGERMQVAVLNWYGGRFWTAEDETGEGFSDNLSRSLVVWRGKGKK